MQHIRYKKGTSSVVNYLCLLTCNTQNIFNLCYQLVVSIRYSNKYFRIEHVLPESKSIALTLADMSFASYVCTHKKGSLHKK